MGTCVSVIQFNGQQSMQYAHVPYLDRRMTQETANMHRQAERRSSQWMWQA